MMYFELSVLLLIDLIQEAFRTSRDTDTSRSTSMGDAHNVSVVLFFCTLREILLNSLISYLSWAQSVPKGVYDRLLADSNTYALRQNILLPSLTGKKWKALIAQETDASQIDYVKLDEFMRTAVEARNKFMHEGKRWGIDRALAEGCMDHTGRCSTSMLRYITDTSILPTLPVASPNQRINTDPQQGAPRRCCGPVMRVV